MVHMKQNDRLPPLEVTIKKTDGTALDLTGATAKLIMVNEATDKVKIAAAATVKDATNGVVEYSWAAGDTNTVGDYRAEIELTLGGLTRTAPSVGYIPVKIYAELA